MFVETNKAIALLKQGEVVALPTETVYGLSADATNAAAVAEIYRLKQRPQFNPLIAHYADINAVAEDVLLNEAAQKCADNFWPGPLTMVLPQQPQSRLATLTCAGLPTAAVRVPSHPLMQQVLAELSLPLAAPSANISGNITATTAMHVASQFPETLPILDGGACDVGLESTIIDLTTDQPAILRVGGIPQADIEACIGPVHMAQADGQIKAPGMLLRHYAPRSPLILTEPATWPAKAVFIFFGEKPAHIPSHVTCLPLGHTDQAAARCLFQRLHEADALQPDLIVAPLIPAAGLGSAINDRLQRAAQA